MCHNITHDTLHITHYTLHIAHYTLQVTMYGVGDHYSLHYDAYYNNEFGGNREYELGGEVWVGNRWGTKGVKGISR